MSFASFQDIVKYAVEKETEAIEFYTEASRHEQYAAARDTFLAFAEEEKKHKALFEKFDPTKIAEYEFTNIADLKRSDYMVATDYKPGMAYPEILRLAMKREENAKKFYDDCVLLASQEEQKKLFQMLSQEEAKHKLKLETLYDDEMAKSGD